MRTRERGFRLAVCLALSVASAHVGIRNGYAIDSGGCPSQSIAVSTLSQLLEANDVSGARVFLSSIPQLLASCQSPRAAARSAAPESPNAGDDDFTRFSRGLIERTVREGSALGALGELEAVSAEASEAAPVPAPAGDGCQRARQQLAQSSARVSMLSTQLKNAESAKKEWADLRADQKTRCDEFCKSTGGTGYCATPSCLGPRAEPADILRMATFKGTIESIDRETVMLNSQITKLKSDLGTAQNQRSAAATRCSTACGRDASKCPVNG